MDRPTCPADLLDLRLHLMDYWKPGKPYWHAVHRGGTIIAGDPSEAARSEYQSLERADLFFVNEDMVDLLEHAAPQMPDQVLHPEDLPTPFGMAFLEKPILGLDAISGERRVKVDAFTWAYGRIPGELRRQKDRIHSIGISCYTFVDTEEGEFGFSKNVWAPIGRSDWPFGDATSTPPWEGIERDRYDSFIEDRRWLYTFWTMVQQVQLTDTVEPTISRQHRRRTERAGQSIPKVKLVTLRRQRSQSNAGTGESTREYHHRWIVSGHWKNVWLPSKETHRLQWINPYQAGPADKPLLVRDTVKVWKR